MAEALIEVRGLVNRFGAQVVHDHLDMTVERGEVFGIVGGSGSGKSVLLRSILGLQRPRAGEVRMLGRDLTQLSTPALKEIKATYGVTFQQGALFSSLTVLQNVQLPMLEHLHLSPRALDELALLKVRLVGLTDEAARKFPAQLSGGMVKRAALARALALDPQLLMDLRQQLGLTVIMITHDLDTIFRTCNRVGVIIDRKMTSDTLEAITRNPHPWIQAYFHGERAQRFGQGKEH